MKNGFNHINPPTRFVQSRVLCVNNGYVLHTLSNHLCFCKAALSGADLLSPGFSPHSWSSTGKACTIQQGSCCIHSSPVGAQSLGLAAREVHRQPGVSEPPAGLLSSYKTPGTWSWTKVASQKTLPAFWLTLREVSPPVNWEAGFACSPALWPGRPGSASCFFSQVSL